ncbi:unnamed protein product [Camellia sinensis]
MLLLQKTKENRQKKKKIADPTKREKTRILIPSIQYKEARKNLLEERPRINNSTLNALILMKWKELSEEDKQT